MVNEDMLRQAIASVEMEGFNVDEKGVSIIRKIINGEIDFKQFLNDCKAGHLDWYFKSEEHIQNESKDKEPTT